MITAENNRLAFSKTRLQSLPVPDEGRVYFHDTATPGLCCCITAANVRTFYLYKKIDGRPTRIRIGPFPEWSIEGARKQAAKLLGQIAQGGNPQSERNMARREHTLEGLFSHWLESHAKLHKKTWQEDQRQFDKFLAPWKTRRLSTISKSELQTLHARIGQQHGHYAANRVLALVKAMFNKGDDIGFRGLNPAHGIKKFQEQSRDRFLQPNELPALFAALQSEEPIFADFFLLALLTGARRSNVQAMQWCDVHLDGACWRIPFTKSGEPVLVHLPAKAVEILSRRKLSTNGSSFVFPTRSATGHLMEPKTAWKRITTAAGLTGLRIHDLRRTLGSWQAIGGASLGIIGQSLGHKSTQSTAVYARLTTAPVVASVDKATDAILAAAVQATPKKSKARKGAK